MMPFSPFAPLQTFPDLGLLSYLLIFVLVAIQGSFVTLLAGLAASRGIVYLPGVIIAAILGNTIADMGWYMIGYLGRFERLIARFSYFRRHEEIVLVLQEEIQEQGLKILVVTKMTMSMVVPTLIAVGMARLPFLRWFPIIFIIEVIWTTLIASFGYFFGQQISRAETGLQILGIVGLFLVLILLLWFIRRVYRRMI
jgi:membrane protein DedA with SNARE-associated domain